MNGSQRITVDEVRRRIAKLSPRLDLGKDVPVLHAYTSRLEAGEVYLEIGTWMGASAVIAALSSHPQAVIWTIDDGEYHQQHWNHTPKQYGALLRKTFTAHGLAERIHFDLRGSREMSWSGPIHLLFINGNHSYSSVKGDIEKWTPFTPPDGVVLFHDYGLYGGVRKAVDESMLEKEWELLPAAPNIRAFRRRRQRLEEHR